MLYDSPVAEVSFFNSKAVVTSTTDEWEGAIDLA